MSARHTHSFCVPAAHPTAALHFPGMPIIPGALLLDEAAAIIAGDAPLRFRAVKFHAPVRHGEALTLSWHEHHGKLLSFEMHRPGNAAPMLTGTLELLA
jgi:3-hydroxymyristoyl/3-hydroxydecanoyl-(acyl carrier protein) dehydratase